MFSEYSFQETICGWTLVGNPSRVIRRARRAFFSAVPPYALVPHTYINKEQHVGNLFN